MKHLKYVHSGEILQKDFLTPMQITPYALAKAIGVDQTRISQIIKGRRRFSADTALRLSSFFGISAEFWLNAQVRYDLEKESEHHDNYKNIPLFEMA